MRSIQILCCVAAAIVLAFAGASRGDGGGAGDEPVPEDEMAEPITGEAVMPNPGNEQPMRDPFTPYDIGGAAAAWRLEDLTEAEQVVARRGLDDDQAAVQAAYAKAARDGADEMDARRSAIRLRIGDAALLGVVP